MFKNFNDDVSVKNLYYETFAGDTCKFYEKYKLTERIGVEKMKCLDGYSGLGSEGFGIFLMKHLDTAALLKDRLKFYFKSNTYSYKGSNQCPFNPLAPPIMIKN